MSSAMAASSVTRSHLALVPHSLSVPTESADFCEDRRGSVRRTISELSWLNQVRLKYGPTVSLIDLSSGGAQIETTSYNLQPGGTVVVEIATGTETICIPSLVLRSYVSGLFPATTYRSRLSFKRPFNFTAFRAANGDKDDRELNLVHEHTRLHVALRRFDETPLQVSGQASGLGRGSLAA